MLILMPTTWRFLDQTERKGRESKIRKTPIRAAFWYSDSLTLQGSVAVAGGPQRATRVFQYSRRNGIAKGPLSPSECDSGLWRDGKPRLLHRCKVVLRVV